MLQAELNAKRSGHKDDENLFIDFTSTEAPEVPEISPVGRKTTGNTGLSILVAEDNAVNQIVIEQILTETGHTYIIVENGKRAVEHHACPGDVPAATRPLRDDRRAHSFSWKW